MLDEIPHLKSFMRRDDSSLKYLNFRSQRFSSSHSWKKCRSTKLLYAILFRLIAIFLTHRSAYNIFFAYFFLSTGTLEYHTGGSEEVQNFGCGNQLAPSVGEHVARYVLHAAAHGQRCVRGAAGTLIVGEGWAGACREPRSTRAVLWGDLRRWERGECKSTAGERQEDERGLLHQDLDLLLKI